MSLITLPTSSLVLTFFLTPISTSISSISMFHLRWVALTLISTPPSRAKLCAILSQCPESSIAIYVRRHPALASMRLSASEKPPWAGRGTSLFARGSSMRGRALSSAISSSWETSLRRRSVSAGSDACSRGGRQSTRSRGAAASWDTATWCSLSGWKWAEKSKCGCSWTTGMCTGRRWKRSTAR